MFQSQQIKVLIADDEPIIATLLARIATSLGFDTDTASSVSAAIKAIESDQPDILLLDLHFGAQEDAGSIVLDSWLNQRHGPCCIISGYVTREIEIAMLVRGADNVVPKPVPAAAVQAILNRYGRQILKDRLIESLKAELAKVKTELEHVQTVMAECSTKMTEYSAKLTEYSAKMKAYHNWLKVTGVASVVLFLVVLGADAQQLADLFAKFVTLIQ